MVQIIIRKDYATDASFKRYGTIGSPQKPRDLFPMTKVYKVVQKPKGALSANAVQQASQALSVAGPVYSLLFSVYFHYVGGRVPMQTSYLCAKCLDPHRWFALY